MPSTEYRQSSPTQRPEVTSPVQRVLVRHEQAAELEARAKEKSKSKTNTISRGFANGQLQPPPEAGLLGRWIITQQEYISKCVQKLEISLGHREMTFETLSSDGKVRGFATYQDTWVFGHGMYTPVTGYSIEGSLFHRNMCEFFQRPICGDFGFIKGCFFYSYPLFFRVGWEGDLMHGEVKNESVGLCVKLRAVRYECDQD